jgi:hypothetical protein
MRRTLLLLVVALIAGLGLAACEQGANTNSNMTANTNLASPRSLRLPG